MFKKILIGLVVVIVIFVVVVALQPSEFRIERSVLISAPAAEIFPHTNDLRKMQEWSPWKKLDPDAKYVRRSVVRRRRYDDVGGQQSGGRGAADDRRKSRE
ncbi:MAG: hypothetical protein U5L01_02070 [Rheinheimera sp.]|nr:hypothetical protein [Rheinheimera sp.]